MRKLIATLVLAVIASVSLSTTTNAMPLKDNTMSLFDISYQKPVVLPTQIEPTKEDTPEEKPKVTKMSTPKVVTYKVREGDNLSLIAEKYNTTWQRIWSKNKKLHNQDMLKVGEKLIIPAKKEKLKNRKPVVQTVPTTTQAPNVAQGGSQSVSGHVSGEPNAYAYGWCTWWVKEKRPEIGGYWGNAGYNWISAAQAAGFSTGSTPRAGAIGVTSGHVVYVESVQGSTVNISEMGWGYRANTTPNYRSAPASSFTYIY